MLVETCHVNDVLARADASQAKGERQEDEDGSGEVWSLAFDGEGYRAKRYIRNAGLELPLIIYHATYLRSIVRLQKDSCNNTVFRSKYLRSGTLARTSL